MYYCTKYNISIKEQIHNKENHCFLCEDCNINPKVSTGMYKQCKYLIIK